MKEREADDTMTPEELAQVNGGATLPSIDLALRAHVDNPGQVPALQRLLRTGQLATALERPDGLASIDGTFPIGTIAPRGHQEPEHEAGAETRDAASTTSDP